MSASDSSQTTVIFPIVKIVFAGDRGVGKSSLIRRYTTGTLDQGHAASTGVDFTIKIIETQGKIIKLSIWDIAGQEQFGAFRDSFYRGARVIALVYDVTQPETFNNLPRWHAEISRICPTARFVIVGNKTDAERAVPRSQVEEWAGSLNEPYLETSAHSGEGTDQLFEELAQLAIKGKK